MDAALSPTHHAVRPTVTLGRERQVGYRVAFFFQNVEMTFIAGGIYRLYDAEKTGMSTPAYSINEFAPTATDLCTHAGSNGLLENSALPPREAFLLLLRLLLLLLWLLLLLLLTSTIHRKFACTSVDTISVRTLP